MTQAEVHALIAPDRESLELVDDWLASYGIFEDSFERSAAQDWVKLKIPIGVAEQMLNTVSAQSEGHESHFLNTALRNTMSGLNSMGSLSCARRSTASRFTSTNTLS